MRISDWSSDVCSSDLDIGVIVKQPLRGEVPQRLAYRGEADTEDTRQIRLAQPSAWGVPPSEDRLPDAVSACRGDTRGAARAKHVERGRLGGRLEKRRVGKGGVGKCGSRWST